ncbi:MAG TPA: DNA-processing protein DprA [Solirubrobacterales bacterium]|nr:DNA-processing protein DprA [Solirubrobacterales bacterium]
MSAEPGQGSGDSRAKRDPGLESAPEAWCAPPGEPGYPAWLADLGDRAPRELHGVGLRAAVDELEHDATVTIVGSRRASPYGLRVAERLGHDLAAAGATVVSGMAWGIDAAAHRGALAAGGTTIAVLAGGADVPYPPSKRDLYARIVGSGAALSERPPGVRPERWSFPERNRIMAALAKLVIVVEAAEPSGSLVTARFAIDRLGRDVGAVPGQVGVRTAAGTNGLIADGAPVIRGAEDALDLLAGVGAVAAGRHGPPLDSGLEAALELVGGGAATADALAAAGLDPRRAAVALAHLELLGYVTADAAGAYSRTSLEPPASRGGSAAGADPGRLAGDLP